MGRAPCCDKTKVKRGPWSPEEDIKLKEFIEKNGTGGNWIALPQKAGLKRCGKSCRLRWLNYLRPNIKHGDFSDDEDRIICTLFATIGSRWSIIAAQLPGRTDNDIKNYWNTKLKKKLLGIPRSERKSSPQQIKQQQQQQQQFIFPTSLDNNIANIATTTNSLSLPSPHLFNGQEVLYQYNQMKEDQRSSTVLMFGGREQSCSSSDGLEEMGFENNYIYNGFEDLGGNNQQASLDVYGNYGDIKHAVSVSDDVYSSLNQSFILIALALLSIMELKCAL